LAGMSFDTKQVGFTAHADQSGLSWTAQVTGVCYAEPKELKAEPVHNGVLALLIADHLVVGIPRQGDRGRLPKGTSP
jgi:hypothetical protein